MITFRLNYSLLLFIVVVIEVIIALYVHDNFIRPFFGDFLASIFVYFILRTFLEIQILYGALLSLAISYFVEILQYLDFLSYSGFGDSRLLRIVLGTSFSWMDILAYTLGVAAILAVELGILKSIKTPRTS